MNDDSYGVGGVYQDNRVHGYNEPQGRVGEREGRGRSKKREKRHPREFFSTLAKRAEASNKELESKGLPYRFCVYREYDEVFIDVVTLDSKGKVDRTVRKNITDYDFDRLIEDVSSLEGLFLDENA